MKIPVLKMKNSMIVFVAIAALSSIAQAEGSQGGLFVEPAVTYEHGDSTVNYPSPFSNSTGTVDGFGLGARIGFHLNEAFFLGFDGRYSMPQFKDSSVHYDAKSVATNWGPVVGFQMPGLGLRLWGSYIMGGELNPEKSGIFDVNFKEATGYRVGAGFRVTVVSLNVEYQQLKYGKANLEDAGPFTGTFNGVDLENKTWIASVSFPLEF